MSTKDQATLDPRTVSLAASLKEMAVPTATFKKNGDGGQDAYLKIGEKEFKSLLPETTTLSSGTVLTRDETYDALLQNLEHRTFVTAGSADALGTVSNDLRKKHDDLHTVNMEVNMGGRDKLKLHWNYKTEENAEIPKKGEVAAKRTVYGAIGGKFQAHGTKVGSGELAKVVDRQKALAESLFGK
jgi:hypothetical protein